MQSRLVLALLPLVLASCGGGPEASSGGAGSGGATTSASTTDSTASAGSAGTGGAGTTTSTAGTGGTGNSDIPGGGTVLFEEKFEDANFDARGWYDGPSGTISTTEHVEGSGAFECHFLKGQTSCAGGKPARHPITKTGSVYMSFHIRFSDNWVGSGKPYHPHMLHFVTDEDGQYVGPAHTYLTTYTEVVQGKALLALQDSKNVDLGCILKNDDTFVGCGGDFASYPFTESRSACSCNGIAGYLDGRDCFPNGDGTWYSSRSWHSDGAFTDQAGASYKGDWHFVEVYFELSSIEGGKGVPNGKIRWVQDGKTLITSDQILFRTGAHADMGMSQLLMLPYIGDGSPVDQTFWIDDLVVATARP